MLIRQRECHSYYRDVQFPAHCLLIGYDSSRRDAKMYMFVFRRSRIEVEFKSNRNSTCNRVVRVGWGQGRRHRGVWGVRRTTPHFCGVYPAGGTTQFTLFTCGVLWLHLAAKVTITQFTFGFSTWKFCFLYSLLQH